MQERESGRWPDCTGLLRVYAPHAESLQEDKTYSLSTSHGTVKLRNMTVKDLIDANEFTVQKNRRGPSIFSREEVDKMSEAQLLFHSMNRETLVRCSSAEIYDRYFDTTITSQHVRVGVYVKKFMPEFERRFGHLF